MEECKNNHNYYSTLFLAYTRNHLINFFPCNIPRNPHMTGIEFRCPMVHHILDKLIIGIKTFHSPLLSIDPEADQSLIHLNAIQIQERFRIHRKNACTFICQRINCQNLAIIYFSSGKASHSKNPLPAAHESSLQNHRDPDRSYNIPVFQAP